MPRINREDTREQPGPLQLFDERVRQLQARREANNPAREAERLERERHQREVERIEREAAQRRRGLEYEQRLQRMSTTSMQREYLELQMRLMADWGMQQLNPVPQQIENDPQRNVYDHATDAQRYYQQVTLPTRQQPPQQFRRFERYAPITADNPLGLARSWEDEVVVTTSPYANVRMVESSLAEAFDNPNRTRRIDQDELTT